MRAAVLHDMSPPLIAGCLTNRKREGFFSVFLLLLALAIIGCCRAYGPASIQRWFGPMPFQSLADLLLLFAAALGAMLLHETGHLFASMGLGFKLLGGTLGPIQIQALHGTWKVSVSMRSFFSGSVSAIPRTMKHWRGAMMIVVAAGPLATLGTMLLATGWHADSHRAVLFQMVFVQVSALLFVLGLIPTGAHSRTHNDTRLLFDLAVQNEGAREMELSVLLTQQVMAGVRPQDYPDTLVKRLAEWRGRPESQLSFAQALVRWALDSDNIELANSWDLRAVALAEKCGSRMRNAGLASSACLDVLFREDLETARNKFARVDFEALFPRCFELRSRAAQQVALGRMHRVGAFVIRAQYAIPRGVPAYELDRSLLGKLHMKALRAALPIGDLTAKGASA